MAIAHAQTGFGSFALGTTAESSTITAVADALYIVCVPYKLVGGTTVTVADSLDELTWTERIAQCAGRDQLRLHVFTAFGSPSDDFTVTATLADDPESVQVGFSVYTGADSAIEDPVAANTNGEGGACSGGSDGIETANTVGGSVDNTVHWHCVLYRNTGNVIATPDEDYTARGDTSTDGGSAIHMDIFDRAVAAAGDQTIDSVLSISSDWIVGGLVIKPAAAGGISVPVALYHQRHHNKAA